MILKIPTSDLFSAPLYREGSPSLPLALAAMGGGVSAKERQRGEEAREEVQRLKAELRYCMDKKKTGGAFLGAFLAFL